MMLQNGWCNNKHDQHWPTQVLSQNAEPNEREWESKFWGNHGSGVIAKDLLHGFAYEVGSPMTNDFSDSNVWETRQPAQWRWILTLSNQDMYRYVISLLNRTTFGRMEVNGTEPTQKSVFHSRWHKDIIEPSPRLCAFPRRARLDPWPRQQVVPRRQAALGLRGWRGQHHCWNTALANQKMLGDWWWSFHLLAFCWKSGITPLRQVGPCQIAIFPLKFQALPQFLDHPILAPDRFTGKPSAHRTGRPRYLLYLGFFRKWGISPKWQWYIMIFYDDKLATFGVQHFQTMSRTCS